MARARSAEKRSALLAAATMEIAAAGLGAATAAIARRAGLAEGTLFTYFTTKDELLNALYAALKSDLAEYLAGAFPANASLRRRVRHVWSRYIAWAHANPDGRRVSMLLHLSDALRPDVRAAAAESLAPVHSAMAELERAPAMRGLPAGSASALMQSMQEWVLSAAAEQPADAVRLARRGFTLYWRAVGGQK